MFCMNCGVELPENAKFCLNCGAPTGNIQSPAKKKSTAHTAESVKFRPVFTEEDENEEIPVDEPAEDDGDSSIQEDTEEVYDEDEDDEADDEDKDEAEVDEEEEEFTADMEDDIEQNDEEDEIEDSEKNMTLDLSGLSIKTGEAPHSTSEEVTGPSDEVLTPANDPYWDDVLPEINDELYQIPKDTIVKAVGIVVAVAASIAWLIFMLPN